MAQVRKRVRLANPARRRRKMSPKQIKYFGTKRQRAALKAKRSHKRRNVAKKTTRRRTSSRRNVAAGYYDETGFHPIRASYDYKPKRAGEKPKRKPRKRTTARRKNVGEIVTIGLNPAPRKRRKTSMATRRKRKTARKRTYRRRTVRARARNPVRRTRRRRVTRRTRRRRNPTRQLLTGTLKNVVGVIGGAAATKLIVDRLPYNLNAGPVGYLSTVVVAAILGFAVGKFGKNKDLGDKMALGGFTYLALRVLQDFVPGLAAISPIGLRGVVPSSFYSPQVQRPGSLTSFVTPSAVTQATAGLQGIGMNRRTARVR